MKHVTLALLLCSILFCCQKKESVLETEQIALNSVFNSVVDSVYLKLTGNKIISKNLKQKTLVIYDSLTAEKPGFVEFYARFQSIKNLYFDTTSEKVTPRIDLQELEKNANFKYLPKLSVSRDSIKESFWNSKTAFPGILLFSKISFDESREFGAFECIITKKYIQDSKHFLIYIQKENDKWKLKEVMERNVLY